MLVQKCRKQAPKQSKTSYKSVRKSCKRGPKQAKQSAEICAKNAANNRSFGAVCIHLAGNGAICRANETQRETHQEYTLRGLFCLFLWRSFALQKDSDAELTRISHSCVGKLCIFLLYTRHWQKLGAGLCY